MTRYVHDPAPNDSAKAFIRWCAENIAEWKEPFASVARPRKASKWWKKNPEWRMRHDGLSGFWVVCTRRQWAEARGEL